MKSNKIINRQNRKKQNKLSSYKAKIDHFGVKTKTYILSSGFEYKTTQLN